MEHLNLESKMCHIDEVYDSPSKCFFKIANIKSLYFKTEKFQ
jgi:hypothetical protein